MDSKALTEELKQFHFWYHKIDLGDGVITPGLDFDQLWNMIRRTRDHINYRDKKVLDLASFDGMWAFEAEKLGSELVVATDCYYETYKNFLFCAKILNSKVIPYYNISPYDLWNRLDVFLQENWKSQQPYQRLFDIVQHFGLLYHLRDPMQSLSQARSVVRTGGYIILETAFVVNQEQHFMIFNGVPPAEQHIYPDLTTWWAPTLPCLKEMLRASLFEPIDETIQVLPDDNTMTGYLKRMFKRFFKTNDFMISRISLAAKAIDSKEIDSEYYRELARTYRNPGLVVEHLGQANKKTEPGQP